MKLYESYDYMKIENEYNILYDYMKIIIYNN